MGYAICTKCGQTQENVEFKEGGIPCIACGYMATTYRTEDEIRADERAKAVEWCAAMMRLRRFQNQVIEAHCRKIGRVGHSGQGFGAFYPCLTAAADELLREASDLIKKEEP